MKWPIKQRVLLITKTPLSDKEIEAAFAGLGDNDPVWLSLMQLLDSSKSSCIDAAATAVASKNNDSALGQVCAWDNLDIFHRDLIDRRDKGLAVR